MTGNKNKISFRKFTVIHGHFYQPPRENPWLDSIETQPSAHPYHDWNERICDECYRPNALSRILDHNGMIRKIYNNYENMSFNFGPTLFLWLEKYHPKLARLIVEADKKSCKKFGGHGNAIAQVFNHIIMPHAKREDQITQIRWGKDFFESRFGRKAEGMWLAETAINNETVACLIDEGIRFVVLSPHQALRYRSFDTEKWTDCEDHPIDTRKPYRIFPDKKEHGDRYLDVFFFDEPLSRAVSFEGILDDSHTLQERIDICYDTNSDEDQVVVIATDGETFGHHKPFGDMCLSYFFNDLTYTSNIEPVNFSWLLAHRPPKIEVELKNADSEGTAWSCAHGTGRWIRDCGCSTGGGADWNQKWRTPLRTALDKLQDIVHTQYHTEVQKYGVDPWKLRNAFIPEGRDCQNSETFKKFLQKHGIQSKLPKVEIARLRTLLEAEMNMLFSFTSCGWFFSDISGIETVQNLMYAGRAIQLIFTSVNERQQITESFLQTLQKGLSNFPNVTGKTLFQKHVIPNFEHIEKISFAAVIEHILAPWKGSSVRRHGYTLTVTQKESKTIRHRKYDRYAVSAQNKLTGEQAEYSILAVHYKGINIIGYLLEGLETADRSFHQVSPHAWEKDENAKKLHMSDLFEASRATLSRYIQKQISPKTSDLIPHWRNVPVIDTLASLEEPLIPYLEAPVKYAITAKFNKALNSLKKTGREDEIFNELQRLSEQAEALRVEINQTFAIELLTRLLHRELRNFSKTLHLEACDRMRYYLNIVDRFGIKVTKSKIEDQFYVLLKNTIYPFYREYIENYEDSPEKKTLLIRIMQFARRMNFNTDMFKL